MTPTTEPPNEDPFVGEGEHTSGAPGAVSPRAVPSRAESPRAVPPRALPSRALPPVTDPVSERREAMNDHLGSWELEGAVPTGFGLEVVRKYVAGETDLDGALDMLKEHDRNGGYARHE